MKTLALLEVLDRDGHVRHYLPVAAWPVTAGRALDNDLVIADPHVAAHHFRVDADERGVFVEAGDSRNGLRADHRRMAPGERVHVGDAPMQLDAGDTHLVLRLAGHALAPELPLATPRSVWHAALPTLVAAVLVLAVLLFDTWLDTDPDNWTRTMASVLVGGIAAALAWCAGWS
ncbi:MAG TPA: FHA domain-containing protein, partial [Albitalea sp.]